MILRFFTFWSLIDQAFHFICAPTAMSAKISF